jgi:hypothetical protein
MALLWIDSFDSYGSSNGSFPTGLDVKYANLASQTNTLVADGRLPGGKSVALGHSSSPVRLIETRGFGNIATWIVGFGFKFGVSYPSATRRLFAIRDAGSPQITVNVKTDGEFEVRRGDVGGTLLATTSGAAPGTATWCHVEFKVTINNSGSYELRINGVNEASGSTDTQQSSNAYAQTVALFGAQESSSDTRWSFDDLFILDSSGSANNDFIGSQAVVCIFPNGAGDETDWTASSGNNYEAVDENGHDGDTSYVASSTSGHQDLYEFGNITLTSIKGAMISAVCRETDATPFDVKLVCKSGTTTDVGPAEAIGSTSYLYRHRVLEEDVDTSSPWDASGINNSQFGFEVEA